VRWFRIGLHGKCRETHTRHRHRVWWDDREAATQPVRLVGLTPFSASAHTRHSSRIWIR